VGSLVSEYAVITRLLRSPILLNPSLNRTGWHSLDTGMVLTNTGMILTRTDLPLLPYTRFGLELE
jgi:hypothetical protein